MLPRTRAAALVTAAAFALSACGSASSTDPGSSASPNAGSTKSADSAANSEPASNTEPTSSNEPTAGSSQTTAGPDTTYPADAAILPTCAEIEAVANGAFEGLTAIDSDGDNPWITGNDMTFTCIWANDAQINADPDFSKWASTGFTITTSAEKFDFESFKSLNMATSTPETEAAGAFILTVGSDYDPAAPASTVVPSLAKGNLSIGNSTQGLFATGGGSKIGLTVGKTMEINLEILKLIEAKL